MLKFINNYGGCEPILNFKFATNIVRSADILNVSVLDNLLIYARCDPEIND
jgi:hypothetical protein